MNKLVACSLSCTLAYTEKKIGVSFFLFETIREFVQRPFNKSFSASSASFFVRCFSGSMPQTHFSIYQMLKLLLLTIFLILLYLSFWTWMTTCLVSSLKISPSRFISLIYYTIIYKYIFPFWKMKNNKILDVIERETRTRTRTQHRPAGETDVFFIKVFSIV